MVPILSLVQAGYLLELSSYLPSDHVICSVLSFIHALAHLFCYHLASLSLLLCSFPAPKTIGIPLMQACFQL